MEKAFKFKETSGSPGKRASCLLDSLGGLDFGG